MKPTSPKSLSCLKSLFCRSLLFAASLGASAFFLPAAAQAAAPGGRTRPNPPRLSESQIQPAPISGSDDIFVTTGDEDEPNALEEYTSTGQPVRSIAFLNNTGSYSTPSTETLRGIAVNTAGQIVGFNGTFYPQLTTFSPK